MRDGAFVNGYTDEILLGSFYALGNSCGYFVGFAEAPAYDSVFITYYYDSSEGEGAAAFGYLGNGVVEFTLLFFVAMIFRI